MKIWYLQKRNSLSCQILLTWIVIIRKNSNPTERIKICKEKHERQVLDPTQLSLSWKNIVKIIAKYFLKFTPKLNEKGNTKIKDSLVHTSNGPLCITIESKFYLYELSTFPLGAFTARDNFSAGYWNIKLEPWHWEDRRSV